MKRLSLRSTSARFRLLVFRSVEIPLLTLWLMQKARWCDKGYSNVIGTEFVAARKSGLNSHRREVSHALPVLVKRPFDMKTAFFAFSRYQTMYAQKSRTKVQLVANSHGVRVAFAIRVVFSSSSGSLASTLVVIHRTLFIKSSRPSLHRTNQHGS